MSPNIIKAGLVFLCFVNVCVVLGGMPEQDRGGGGLGLGEHGSLVRKLVGKAAHSIHSVLIK